MAFVAAKLRLPRVVPNDAPAQSREPYAARPPLCLLIADRLRLSHGAGSGHQAYAHQPLGRQLRWPLSRSANNRRQRLSFSLSALCQVSISLYEAPQPKLRGGIRCSEHQHAHAFCASEAIFGTKHFGYFPLSLLGRPFPSCCKAQCRGCGGRIKRRPAPNGLALREVTPSPARPTERQFLRRFKKGGNVCLVQASVTGPKL